MEIERKLIDLSWCVGILVTHPTYPSLIIVSPSDTGPEVPHTIPAQSLEIYGEKPLRELKNVLNDFFEIFDREKKEK